jgi:hypothetical protein
MKLKIDEDNPDLTLVEWRTRINNWIDQYGAQSMLEMLANPRDRSVSLTVYQPLTFPEFVRKVNATLGATSLFDVSKDVVREAYGKKSVEETAELVKQVEAFFETTKTYRSPV